MTTRSLHIGLLLTALLAACSSSDAATRQYQPQDRPYFTGSIPPCTPVEGGDGDPCPRHDTDSNSRAVIAPPADTPRSAAHLMRFSDIDAAHLVLRVTFLPGTVRCEIRKTERSPTWLDFTDQEADDDELGKITCYGDVRVNEYILGTGPRTLTLLLAEVRSFRESVSGREAERRRRAAENDLVQGDDSVFDWVPEGGIEGLELIQFVGPAADYGIETLQTFGGLRLNRREDGMVVVLHPYWNYWSEVDYERYRSQIEWSLADFKALITAAHQQRVTDWGGRVGPDAHVPVAHTDANTLHDFYVNIGAYDHPDGPPVLPPPAR